MANPIACMAHPLGASDHAGIAANVARAKRWFTWLLRAVSDVDFAANWILWCEALDDLNPEHRERGLAFDDAEILRHDEYWMVGGAISSGMERGRLLAASAGKRIVNLTELGPEPPQSFDISDWCGQCGQKLSVRACGPTHAMRKSVRSLLEIRGACRP